MDHARDRKKTHLSYFSDSVYHRTFGKRIFQEVVWLSLSCLQKKVLEILLCFCCFSYLYFTLCAKMLLALNDMLVLLLMNKVAFISTYKFSAA